MLETATLALFTLTSLSNVAAYSSVSIFHGFALVSNAKEAMARIILSKNLTKSKQSIIDAYRNTTR
jgi:hypothetical protein